MVAEDIVTILILLQNSNFQGTRRLQNYLEPEPGPKPELEPEPQLGFVGQEELKENFSAPQYCI
jgi:hypothetical protein